MAEDKHYPGYWRDQNPKGSYDTVYVASSLLLGIGACAVLFGLGLYFLSVVLG